MKTRLEEIDELLLEVNTQLIHQLTNGVPDYELTLELIDKRTALHIEKMKITGRNIFEKEEFKLIKYDI